MSKVNSWLIHPDNKFKLYWNILLFIIIFYTISVVVFYAFREIYVSLLSTQQWAFIASILDSSTSSYMVNFSGIVSISSAVGGCMIEPLVSLWGVNGILLLAMIAIAVSHPFQSLMSIHYYRTSRLRLHL